MPDRSLSRWFSAVNASVVSHPISMSSEASLAIADLAAAFPVCSTAKKSSDAVRTFLALAYVAGAFEQARACLLHHLNKGAAASSASWALASTVFTSHHTALLAQARSQRVPATYDIIGPFPIGKNEVDGDPLAAHGGAFAHWLTHHNASLGRGTHAQGAGHVASELASGGYVSWEPTRPTADGSFRVGWSDAQVMWGGLVQSMGQRAVLEVQAWAFGTLAVIVPGHYALDCRGVHKAWLYDAAAPHVACARALRTHYRLTLACAQTHIPLCTHIFIYSPALMCKPNPGHALSTATSMAVVPMAVGAALESAGFEWVRTSSRCG